MLKRFDPAAALASPAAAEELCREAFEVADMRSIRA
jgi:hypothetical protein